MESRRNQFSSQHFKSNWTNTSLNWSRSTLSWEIRLPTWQKESLSFQLKRWRLSSVIKSNFWDTLTTIDSCTSRLCQPVSSKRLLLTGRSLRYCGCRSDHRRRKNLNTKSLRKSSLWNLLPSFSNRSLFSLTEKISLRYQPSPQVDNRTGQRHLRSPNAPVAIKVTKVQKSQSNSQSQSLSQKNSQNLDPKLRCSWTRWPKKVWEFLID